MTEHTEYSYELKIPKDRVAVLIGKKGKIKKDIGEATNSKIKRLLVGIRGLEPWRLSPPVKVFTSSLFAFGGRNG